MEAQQVCLRSYPGGCRSQAAGRMARFVASLASNRNASAPSSGVLQNVKAMLCKLR